MKLIAKLLTGIGVLVGLGYLCCRGIGEKLHLFRSNQISPSPGDSAPSAVGRIPGEAFLRADRGKYYALLYF